MNSPRNRSFEFLRLAVALAAICRLADVGAAETNGLFAPFLRALGTNEPRVFLLLGTNQFPAVLAAAEKGDLSAQVFIGDCYWRGEVVAKDAVQAATWYRKAAELGHLAAQFKLGVCLLQSSAASNEQSEGVNWVRKAAERDHVQALSLLGRLYDQGWGGVGTNTSEALQWYRRAADLRDDWARLRLGQLYAQGRAVARDPVEALKWYELAGRDGKQFAEQARAEGSALASTMTIPDVIEGRRRASAYVPHIQSSVISNSAPMAARPINVGSIISPASPAQMTIEAPMELRNNRPIVSVRVNDSKPLRLLFDSGSSISILTKRAASKLKLKPTSTIKLNAEPVETVEGLTFNLAGASYRPRIVAVHPMKYERIVDPFLDGIVGADLLQQFVVELDYRGRKIRLRDLARYKPTGSGVNLLMRFQGNRPFVDALLLPQSGQSIKGTWLIDTGASGAIYLGKGFDNRNSLREAAGGARASKSIALSKTAETPIGHLWRFHIGHFLVEKPEVTFLEEELEPFGNLSGAIGGEILRRFKVTFHYGRQQLTLEPNGLPPKPTLTGETGSELFN